MLLGRGLRANTLTFVYGPEKTGKTTFALDRIAMSALINTDAWVLFFSLEIPAPMIYARAMLNMVNRRNLGITIERWESRHDRPLLDDDRQALAEAWTQLQQWQRQGRFLVIDTPPEMSPESFAALLENLYKGKREAKGKMLIIIYDHILQSKVVGKGGFPERNKNIVIEETVRTLIETKKRPSPIAIVALGHANRDFIRDRAGEYMMPEPHHVYGSSMPAVSADAAIALFNPKTVRGLPMHFGVEVSTMEPYIVARRVLSRYDAPFGETEAVFYRFHGSEVRMSPIDNLFL
ncbi:MAG: hypothetical protein D6790_20350 [Caldilineae bacterium]|nr:MAG: hypothetical protein D6790_20350 [Caldilineae bacterium]